MPHVSIEKRILKYVQDHPWASAGEIGRAIDRSGGAVSSQLLKMCNDGKLVRETGRGPRGGYGYALGEKTRLNKSKPKIPLSRSSWHDRLLKDDDL